MKQLILLVLVTILSACASSPIDMAIKGDLNGLLAELNKGGDINAYYGEDKMTLLGAAAKGGKIYIIDELLARGADIEKGGSPGYRSTPLMIAVYAGRLIPVKHLLEKGADINRAETGYDKGTTVLHYASGGIKGDSEAEMIRLLLDNGANLFAVDKRGKNAAHYAVPRGDTQLSVLIQEARALDKRYAEKTGDTRQHALNWLLNLQDKSGMTPLHMAAHSFHGLDEARILLKAGANPNLKAETYLWDHKKTSKGLTPLHLAADAKNNKVMNLLLRYGADPNAVTARGESPRSLYRKSSVWKESEFNFGKALAIAGGAALASSSNMSSVQKTEFMTNFAADVATDSGGTNMRDWGKEQSEKMQSQNKQAGKGGAGVPEPPFDEMYSDVCPDTQKRFKEVRVSAYSQQCFNAAKFFMKMMNCNMLNEHSKAIQDCNTHCKDPNCLDLPPGGAAAASSGGSGDADMDFLNNMGR